MKNESVTKQGDTFEICGGSYIGKKENSDDANDFRVSGMPKYCAKIPILLPGERDLAEGDNLDSVVGSIFIMPKPTLPIQKGHQWDRDLQQTKSFVREYNEILFFEEGEIINGLIPLINKEYGNLDEQQKGTLAEKTKDLLLPLDIHGKNFVREEDCSLVLNLFLRSDRPVETEPQGKMVGSDFREWLKHKVRQSFCCCENIVEEIVAPENGNRLLQCSKLNLPVSDVVGATGICGPYLAFFAMDPSLPEEERTRPKEHDIDVLDPFFVQDDGDPLFLGELMNDGNLPRRFIRLDIQKKFAEAEEPVRLGRVFIMTETREDEE